MKPEIKQEIEKIAVRLKEICTEIRDTNLPKDKSDAETVFFVIAYGENAEEHGEKGSSLICTTAVTGKSSVIDRVLEGVISGMGR